ncbi:MAG TPA: glycosyltransferase [Puia sp.]|jgi:glycosyltransferase involved in cell wall biosynthesis|nr:glycosyltransferase [Puia sp.]
MNTKPLVSFCISTYKRPEILSKQLKLLLQQTYTNFLIVISDNDPGSSAKKVSEEFSDSRIQYHTNGENLGIVKSFNKSIERSITEYVVMITDDDPLQINFLDEIMPLIENYPGYSMYSGFLIKKKFKINTIDKNEFPTFVLDPDKNPSIFWSNCVLRKSDVIDIGMIPDYGSPHLADHALLAMVGSKNGCVIKNAIYSSHFLHDNSYSRGNLDSYFIGCVGFYNVLKEYFDNKKIEIVIKKHLKFWFIAISFSLRKFFRKDKNRIAEIDTFSNKMLQLNFMKSSQFKYFIKKKIFAIKVFLKLV